LREENHRINPGCNQIINHKKEQRRKYDKDFKMEILCLVNEKKRSIAQVARDFGIGENTIYKWRKALEEDQ